MKIKMHFSSLVNVQDNWTSRHLIGQNRGLVFIHCLAGPLTWAVWVEKSHILAVNASYKNYIPHSRPIPSVPGALCSVKSVTVCEVSGKLCDTLAISLAEIQYSNSTSQVIYTAISWIYWDRIHQMFLVIFIQVFPTCSHLPIILLALFFLLILSLEFITIKLIDFQAFLNNMHELKLSNQVVSSICFFHKTCVPSSECRFWVQA